MKTVLKVVATVAAVVICLGLVIGIVGLVLGATLDSLSWDWGFSQPDFSAEYTDVESLDFELGYADVVIEEGDTFSVNATKLRSRFTSKVENGVWKIEMKNPRATGRFREDHSPRVVITLPKGFVARELDLEIGMGTLDTLALDTGFLQASRKASLEVGMGQMDLTSVTAPEISLECGMGSLNAGLLNSSDIEIDCGMGQVDATIDGAENDYNYKISTGMGDVTVGNSSVSGMGQKQQSDRGGSGYLSVDCGMGSVTVDFTK